MKEQSKDNFRCLVAVIFVVAVPILEYAVQDTWFPNLPGWTPIVIFFAMFPVAFRFFNPQSKPDRKPDQVSFDDSTITRTMPNGKTETVRWDDLKEVGIITTDEGPFNEDVYWILEGINGGCAVSGGAEGMKELLGRLQKLPGFDNKAVIEAMGSTQNNRFLCWRRKSEAQPKNKE
jgi:hypothetical protein